MTVTTAQTEQAPTSGGGLLQRVGPRLGVAPFFVYTILFLMVPTVIVIVGAFQTDTGGFTLQNIRAINTSPILSALGESLQLSLYSALIGAVVGGAAAYVISTGNPKGMLRRVMTSASSVLAQFGGVMLAFAFIFTVGRTGIVGRFLQAELNYTIDPNWLPSLPGLTLVYSYFQIPLMIIIFLPAVDGIRPQWREATESLGGSTWVFWRRVAGPLLAPAFLGSLLLLFTNAFSSFATAAALIGTTDPILPLQIRHALISETGSGNANLAKSLALLMVVVVAILMWIYYRVQRRASRWLR
ncbi:putative spermidine/putrescine transport system permease protein [Nakamurella panacisegetis]|uniref:Putative spermidine/putrescine transport system permease protein n=1 Tax=Nakamurella panacisegetis TaxID=1090615 RepID=A0A1H0JJX4_9ACTN|nr:ABC transporter permease subunit [Nakamurella panacisegetis]SDO44105.1 putative spermidine/putrescine transport system permease protein [Nakamurella panacisegetis]